jgi:hypothetical protein
MKCVQRLPAHARNREATWFKGEWVADVQSSERHWGCETKFFKLKIKACIFWDV